MRSMIITGLICIYSVSGSACDICGCSISNNNPFLFPYLAKNYISMNYIHRTYLTGVGTTASSRQHFNTVMLSGQYSVSKKLKFSATLPYQHNQMKFGNERILSNGIGDASVMGNYMVWDKMTKIKRQSVIISGGIKLPTGKYVIPDDKSLVAQNFQLGTGSVDYLLSGAYRLNFRKWVFSASGTYKYNTQNSDGFRFGDVMTAGATAVYRKELNKFSVTPYVQLIHEKQMKDADQHILKNHSGGHVLYNGLGIDVNTKRITGGINYQYAIDQFLTNGEISVQPKITAHISFGF